MLSALLQVTQPGTGGSSLQGSRACPLNRFAATQSFITEKAMAPHSSTLAWKIPWTEEPGRLQSMGSLRVGHDRATSLSLFTFMHWRRKWQPSPVFLPGESQGRGSPVGCCLWGRTESDATEVTQQYAFILSSLNISTNSNLAYQLQKANNLDCQNYLLNESHY